ncbi:hypothetical protein [Pseudomonas atacamensis]|uniref:hypothetical protein n=1 Tax=Pseudomonas atacamensis TaxID=2565368 RepID=UPI002448F1DD|nr:hypothetical protein [Pseudomonas atacamensis]MDH2077048.1 hypothetical protein [Pseudomonas atacamensis]
MNTRQITLANRWTATFQNIGEFRMGVEGWGLLLQGPNNQTIKYFADQIVLANDEDGNQANTCILLSGDGVYGYLRTAIDGDWVIDFARGMIAPHRVTIRHHHDAYDESLSLYEQPAFKRARQYVSVVGKHIYLTFPLTRDEDFPNLWEEYLAIRKRQLDELYFAT